MNNRARRARAPAPVDLLAPVRAKFSRLEKLMKCTFTSVWDDGSEITTPATYDPKTGEVSAESSRSSPKGSLEREFITLQDEEEIEVCNACHTFVMKTVVGDLADLSFGESTECSDPNCESNSINYV